MGLANSDAKAREPKVAAEAFTTIHTFLYRMATDPTTSQIIRDRSVELLVALAVASSSLPFFLSCTKLLLFPLGRVSNASAIFGEEFEEVSDVDSESDSDCESDDLVMRVSKFVDAHRFKNSKLSRKEKSKLFKEQAASIKALQHVHSLSWLHKLQNMTREVHVEQLSSDNYETRISITELTGALSGNCYLPSCVCFLCMCISLSVSRLYY